MSLIVWDESGEVADSEHTDPDAILAALAEAGVLKVEPQAAFELFGRSFGPAIRYVSRWKEAK